MLEAKSRLLFWESIYPLLPNTSLLLTCWEAAGGIMLNSIELQKKSVQFREVAAQRGAGHCGRWFCRLLLVRETKDKREAWNFCIEIRQEDGGKLASGSQSLHMYCILFKLMLLALLESWSVLCEMTTMQPRLQLSVTKKKYWWTGPHVLGRCAAHPCSKELTVCRSKTHRTAAEPLACVQENYLFLLTSHTQQKPLPWTKGVQGQHGQRGKVQTSSYQQKSKAAGYVGASCSTQGLFSSPQTFNLGNSNQFIRK